MSFRAREVYEYPVWTISDMETLFESACSPSYSKGFLGPRNLPLPVIWRGPESKMVVLNVMSAIRERSTYGGWWTSADSAWLGPSGDSIHYVMFKIGNFACRFLSSAISILIMAPVSIPDQPDGLYWEVNIQDNDKWGILFPKPLPCWIQSPDSATTMVPRSIPSFT